jgi:threonylcarbamoyladenosine tRNA methylthiotransferase MtaB
MESQNTLHNRVSLHTIGCKLNFAETSTFGASFQTKGFQIVDFKANSDVVVINTCSVTENADRDCRKAVRQALRRSPEAFIIVVGCYAQLRPEEIASIEGVDLVLGAEEKFHMFDYLDGFKKGDYPRVHVGNIEDATSYGPAFTSEASDRTRAFLKVQDGCDYNCSFCTIPMARGASRSVGIDATLANAREVLDAGYKEIVLSGVNVGDFGRKIDSSFYELLKELVALPGEFRLRISSIEPNLLTDEIIELSASSDKMCNHFHIPLQSGSPDTLQAMRRRYTRDIYRDRVEKIKERIPDCAIGVDVIVGFPGESNEHFDETYKFLVDLPISYLHVFSYSERPGTHSIGLGGQVSPEERARRSQMLRILSEKKRRQFYMEQLGSDAIALMEGRVQDGIQFGFTSNYVKVGMPASSDIENSFIPVQLNSICGAYVDAVEVNSSAL